MWLKIVTIILTASIIAVNVIVNQPKVCHFYWQTGCDAYQPYFGEYAQV